MKTIKQISAALVFAAAVSASGAAVAIPIVDVVDSSPNVTIAYLGSYTFTHDITDNGFVAGADTLNSASLSILLRDDAGNEIFQFEVGLGQTAGYSNVNNGSGGQTYAFALAAPSISDLGGDGLISVKIQSLAGTSPSGNDHTGFIFDKSTLTAEVTKGVTVQAAAIPEPATITLMGLGLAGLGFMAWRRRESEQA